MVSRPVPDQDENKRDITKSKKHLNAKVGNNDVDELAPGLSDFYQDSSPVGWGLLAPFIGLGLVGGVLIWRGRKRQKMPRLVRVVESVSLGPKRALVVAEVQGEKVVLGTSEAGISVLSGSANMQVSPFDNHAAMNFPEEPTGDGFGDIFHEEVKGVADTRIPSTSMMTWFQSQGYVKPNLPVSPWAR